MSGSDWLAERFESTRGHLRAVAYRLLGSSAEAEDAVQECWLRASRADTTAVENLEGWLTTVVARICLNMLRLRRSRREEALETHAAEPLGAVLKTADPEREALMAESVGLALLVVLERLAPAERVAFVLHDVFAVPFEDIAATLGRTPEAARQLASRARRRVRGTESGSQEALSQQRNVVEAFLSALRAGDVNGLLAVLDPDVVRRADQAAVLAGSATELRGAGAVLKESLTHRDLARFARPSLVNGTVGIVVAPQGHLRVAISCTVRAGKIAEMEVMADPARLRGLNLSVVGD